MSRRLSRTFYTLGGIRINTAIVVDLYKNNREKTLDKMAQQLYYNDKVYICLHHINDFLFIFL